MKQVEEHLHKDNSSYYEHLLKAKGEKEADKIWRNRGKSPYLMDEATRDAIDEYISSGNPFKFKDGNNKWLDGFYLGRKAEDGARVV